jgi:hypothetical protein
MIFVFCLVRGIIGDGLVLSFVWFENREKKVCSHCLHLMICYN